MNIYMCREPVESWIFFVRAETRGQARSSGTWEFDMEFTSPLEIRLFEKNVGGPRGVIRDESELGLYLWDKLCMEGAII